MVRIFSNLFDLPHSWPQTAYSVWHKYPNPHAEHVVSMDVLNREYDAETGLLRIERLLGVRQGAPRWVVKLIGGGDDNYVREVTMIDPEKESFQMTSTNLSLSKYLLVKEYITYLPSRAAQDRDALATTFSQRAVIECTGLSGGMLDRAARKIEDLSLQRFHDNASKGRAGIVSVCRAMWGSANYEE